MGAGAQECILFYFILFYFIFSFSSSAPCPLAPSKKADSTKQKPLRSPPRVLGARATVYINRYEQQQQALCRLERKQEINVRPPPRKNKRKKKKIKKKKKKKKSPRKSYSSPTVSVCAFESQLRVLRVRPAYL